MIISLVANVINIFATTLRNILLLASFTGQLIVSVVTWISSVIFNIIQTIASFFQIVYEDNVTIFSEDIPASVYGVYDTIQSQLEQVHSGISDIYNTTYIKICGGLSAVNWLVKIMLMMCNDVLTVFKSTIIFAGDTMWLIITFIPVHLPLLLRAAFKSIGTVVLNIVIDGYMLLLKFTNYLTEVPLQSLMGITSAIVIARLCIHFRETIYTQIILLYWSLVRNILYLYYVIFNYFSNPDIAIIPRIVSGEDLMAREVNLSSHEADEIANAADALCVICQEQQKCVLTLPCRHVCLCADCCRRLYGYQRTCPICRTFIYHSVTVYL